MAQHHYYLRSTTARYNHHLLSLREEFVNKTRPNRERKSKVVEIENNTEGEGDNDEVVEIENTDRKVDRDEAVKVENNDRKINRDEVVKVENNDRKVDREEVVTDEEDESLIELPQREVFICGDGNCLYRAISYHIYDTQDKHMRVRYDIAEFALKNETFIMPDGQPLLTWIQYSDEEHSNVKNYCSWIVIPGTYGGFLECGLASIIYKIRIVVATDVKTYVYGDKSLPTLFLYLNEYTKHFSVLED
jgi:hypothetical protein